VTFQRRSGSQGSIPVLASFVCERTAISKKVTLRCFPMLDKASRHKYIEERGNLDLGTAN
jgi:hypothetical protein